MSEEESYSREDRIRNRNTSKKQPAEGSGFTASLAVECILIVIMLGAAFIIKLAGGEFYIMARQYTQLYLITNISINEEKISDSINEIKEVIQSFYNTYIVPADSDKDNTSSGEDEQNSSQTQDADDGQGGANPVNAVLTSEAWEAPPIASFTPYFITAVFTKPVEGTITSTFGYRIHPITEELDFHTGIDIAAPSGTAIFCAMDGEVIEIGKNSVYGNFIIIKHADNLKTFYGHLDAILVQVEYQMKRGEIIGRVGSTGLSTGPHLHFEIRIEDICYNPIWIYNGESIDEFYDIWCKN